MAGRHRRGTTGSGTPASCAGGWAKTELARVLPIEIHDGDRVVEHENRAKLELTDPGLMCGILRIRNADADTIRKWSMLPWFLDVNRVGRPKASTLILARIADGEPLLLVHTVGKGRVLAFAREAWSWWRFR